MMQEGIQAWIIEGEAQITILILIVEVKVITLNPFLVKDTD